MVGCMQTVAKEITFSPILHTKESPLNRQRHTSKQRKKTRTSRDSIYPYYAAFSSVFARATVEKLRKLEKSSVFDPWNGSGTLTLAARVAGMDAVGSDISPAMVIAAKAKLCEKREAAEILTSALARAQKRARGFPDCSSSDPLRRWFDERTISIVRATCVEWESQGFGLHPQDARG